VVNPALASGRANPGPGARPRHYGTRMPRLRLNTFVISHFSEKARWALDLAGLPYAERRLLPGPHMPVIRRIAPSTTVPVLEHDGRAIQGSRDILDHLERALGARRLAPEPHLTARCAELEALCDDAFGRGVQRIFYFELLPDRDTVTALWSQEGPIWGRVFYRFAYPGVAAAVRRMYRTVPDAVDRAKARFREAADRIDAALGEHAYLLGDTPTRADVTFAALFAPVCRPAEHLVRWPEPRGALKTFCSEFEGRPLWNHAMRMYREHRRGAGGQ
jgi:glutathione S-transferase